MAGISSKTQRFNGFRETAKPPLVRETAFDDPNLVESSGVVKLKLVTNCGNPRWRVSYQVDGRNRREYFETESEARKRATAIRQERSLAGDRWLVMPAHSRAAVILAHSRALKGGYTLAQACDLWERQQPGEAETLGALIDRIKAARATTGLRSKTVQNAHYQWRYLLDRLGDIPIDTITPEMVEASMHRPEWSPGMRREHRAKASILFAWAVKRRLMEENPVDRIDAPRVPQKPPGILTVPECRRLLRLTRDDFPRLLPCVLTMLFAGVRPVEAARLRWEDVRIPSGRIVVEAAASKLHQRRLVTIHPTLRAWLETIPAERRTGPMAGKAHSWHMDRLRATFGGVPADGLRHSFVSYHVAAFHDIPRTAMEAGHSVSILMRHYRELVTPEDAEAFWALLPDAPARPAPSAS